MIILKMTIEEYIKNPMGKDNAVFSQRDMFKNLYTDKFSKVMMREGGELKYRLFKDSDSRYLIHLKIPSEAIERFYYDVILEFTSINPIDILSPSITGYNVKFFSNDPAFVFTYAYSFNQNKLFINDLDSKMSKEALREKAKIRNPKNLVGYVKSIYFAYLYMKAHGLLKKSTWSDARGYDQKLLLSQIMQADEKIHKRQLLEEEKKKEKHTKKPKPVNRFDQRHNSSDVVQPVKSVARTKIVSKTKTVSTIKYTKRK